MHKGELGITALTACQLFLTISLSRALAHSSYAPPCWISAAVARLETGYCPCAGTSPRWCWSEDEADVIVETAASGASSARDISVKFQPRHLALRCLGPPQAIQVSC